MTSHFLSDPFKREDFQKATAILSSSSESRTEADLQILESFFTDKSFLKPLTLSLSSNRFKTFLSLLQYESHSKDSNIFEKGSIGLKYYILLQGKAMAHITQSKDESGDFASEIKKQLVPGNGFGEFAVTDRVVRARGYTITCSEDCHLATLSRGAFLMFIGKVRKKVVADVELMSLHPCFSYNIWSRAALLKFICEFSPTQTLKQGTVIYKEGEFQDKVYFLKSGTLTITSTRQKPSEVSSEGQQEEQCQIKEGALLGLEEAYLTRQFKRIFSAEYDKEAVKQLLLPKWRNVCGSFHLDGKVINDQEFKVQFEKKIDFVRKVSVVRHETATVASETAELLSIDASPLFVAFAAKLNTSDTLISFIQNSITSKVSQAIYPNVFSELISNSSFLPTLRPSPTKSLSQTSPIRKRNKTVGSQFLSTTQPNALPPLTLLKQIPTPLIPQPLSHPHLGKQPITNTRDHIPNDNFHYHEDPNTSRSSSSSQSDETKRAYAFDVDADLNDIFKDKRKIAERLEKQTRAKGGTGVLTLEDAKFSTEITQSIWKNHRATSHLPKKAEYRSLRGQRRDPSTGKHYRLKTDHPIGETNETEETERIETEGKEDELLEDGKRENYKPSLFKTDNSVIPIKDDQGLGITSDHTSYLPFKNFMVPRKIMTKDRPFFGLDSSDREEESPNKKMRVNALQVQLHKDKPIHSRNLLDMYTGVEPKSPLLRSPSPPRKKKGPAERLRPILGTKINFGTKKMNQSFF